MKKQDVKTQTASPDDALRVGDFSLLPNNPRPPVITSHPIRNFVQLTWASKDANGDLTMKSVNPVIDTFTVRQGTRVKWTLYCVDPSNVNNINDTSNLSFIWKKDGQSLFNINNQNNGMGSPEIEYSEDECTGLIDGEYVCEVSNEFGVTTSVPFTLQVVDIDADSNLYTNLLQNGDGEGGLDGWTDNTGKVKAVVSNVSRAYNPNTMTRYIGTPYQTNTGFEYFPPQIFKFNTQTTREQLFYNGYQYWKDQVGPDFLNLTIDTSPAMLDKFPTWYKYTNIKQRSSIIPNEDITMFDDSLGGKINRSPQGFFPSVNYMDRYNRNRGAFQGFINLSEELKIGSKPKSYFTRDLISFEDIDTVTFKQAVNLSERAGMIDGQVGGVDYMTVQFFSYIAIALSRYKIRYTDENGNIAEKPWLVHDFETYKKWMTDPTSVAKIPFERAKGIDIIPYADDTTSIKITCFDLNGNQNKQEILKGPDAMNLWAVKEKIDISLMLFPLYMFFTNSKSPECPIRVFGQTYTNLNTFYKVTVGSENNPTGLLHKNVIDDNGWNSNKAAYETNDIKDTNMTFLMKRYGELYRDSQYPTDTWKRQGTPPNDWYSNTTSDTAQGFGITTNSTPQAWFAVGTDLDLPNGTRDVTIEVSFTNNSPARTDSSPKAKGWNQSDIYNSLHRVDGGVTAASINPYYAYGEPRCAITSMKLLLIPNRDIASKKHTTYTIPPANSTVAGLAKQAVQQPLWNATPKPTLGFFRSTPTPFEYPLIQPGEFPVSPEPDTDTVEVLKEAYNESTLIEDNQTNPKSDRFTNKENRQFGALSIDQEGIDQDETRLPESDEPAED
jgi:hypothetical protein